MALEPMSAKQLAEAPTLFASFLGHADRRHKTVGDLLAIYRERRRTLRPAEDPADDLRVDRFMGDMAGNRWRAAVIIRIGVFDGRTLVIDGIHRAIAYLACVEDGMSSDRLPALQVDC
ncbi:MAG TPA: hypothetical protein VGN08_12030 [Solirubrobacteraceae bacterium]|jgi:hypothetical protein